MVHPYNRRVVLPGGGVEAGGGRPESESGLQRGKTSRSESLLSLSDPNSTLHYFKVNCSFDLDVDSQHLINLLCQG